MGRIQLIIQREYITRVRKKSFIAMTLLGPILMAAMIIVPTWLAMRGDTGQKTIAIVDETNTFSDKLKDTENVHFSFFTKDQYETIKSELDNNNYYGILTIGEDVYENTSDVTFHSKEQMTISTDQYLSGAIRDVIRQKRIDESGIDPELISQLDVWVSIKSMKLTEDGGEKESSVVAGFIISFFGAFMIYMIILLYGVQVMRGVIEEKTGRIIEVLISSVKPFELMMGKILGIALVIITQLTLWGVMTSGIVAVVSSQFLPQTEQVSQADMAGEAAASVEAADLGFAGDIFSTLLTMNYPLVIGAFLFYFIFGYLLYASMFAAVGSAGDNETDSQQFVFPVTLPLILSIVMMQGVIHDPNGSLARWMSLIPFTSPVIMLVRIPGGSFEMWELLLSMFLLVITFVGITWLAGRIYRVGILMYGKKVSFKELAKWLTYKV